MTHKKSTVPQGKRLENFLSVHDLKRQ
ncbi:MAG: DUF1752 domain-containing protein [Candidatus Liberibacter ctenarytainae]|uniref:DUF1752 domain-containing protein n=1 Tax=Candidatus Liberibacter ctenarytainae TaxID=2020335 RepID=A0A937AC60_9HYPH|nr:DUF1752 domain-containing protein [Candidatus Liberibacter ctenarytainae]